MARLARVTIPGIPHHVTQRGNRRQPVFFCPSDRQYYLHCLLEESRRAGVQFWAYCLMDNHVHFIVVPEQADSLARTFGEAHRRYTRMVNTREGWTGYLWQGRFASFPLDEAHLYAAIRYVERNPVAAGMVTRAEAYAWSSARAHVEQRHDPILTSHFVADGIADWAGFLHGDDESFRTRMTAHARTGRPLGDAEFLERMEQVTGRQLAKQPAGRKKQ
jgi:putative transposase